MRTINPYRIYSCHEFVQIMNEIYKNADDAENVRTRTISSENGISTIHISYYEIDCEFIEFNIKVRTH